MSKAQKLLWISPTKSEQRTKLCFTQIILNIASSFFSHTAATYMYMYTIPIHDQSTTFSGYRTPLVHVAGGIFHPLMLLLLISRLLQLVQFLPLLLLPQNSLLNVHLLLHKSRYSILFCQS